MNAMRIYYESLASNSIRNGPGVRSTRRALGDCESVMKGFSTLDNPSHQGATNNWLTPLPLIHSLGEFDLDPCAFRGHWTANQMYFARGLSLPWRGRVWLNPPYGKATGVWLDRLQDHDNGIALVFARTDTGWFHKLRTYHSILFIKGRIKFLQADFTELTNAGHGSMLVAFGANNTVALHQSGIEGKLFINHSKRRDIDLL